MIKKKRLLWLSVVFAVIVFLAAGSLYFFASYKRPYQGVVTESGLDESLVYAVMKAESGFRENARSGAGAIGLMQILPATAQFMCERNGLDFDLERLYDGEYNVKIGCLYLSYLLQRFPVVETALSAYNAGEGTVSDWLKNPEYSSDGIVLAKIPYEETRIYVKKIMRFHKIYDFLGA